jgi:hypothetical protein
MAAPEMAAPEMAAPEMAAPEMAADEVPPAPPDGIELTCGQASGPPGPAGA